jgi:hypothetical protein
MSDWIRSHSGHKITIVHKENKGNVDGDFERFLCSCEACNEVDLFYYIIGQPREKKPNCEECAG